jgi:hypothetical protein
VAAGEEVGGEGQGAAPLPSMLLKAPGCGGFGTLEGYEPQVRGWKSDVSEVPPARIGHATGRPDVRAGAA